MKIFLLCLLSFMQIYSFNAKQIDCPDDWYKFNSSCYKNYPAAPYSIAMVCIILFFDQIIKNFLELKNFEINKILKQY